MDLFHSVGLKATAARLAVYQFLTTTPVHPTAEQIHQALHDEQPSLSLSTVYNTLDALVAVGLVNALGNNRDGKVHFDGNVTPHINLACTVCGEIRDLPSPLVGQMGEAVSTQSGFAVTNSRILFQGVCADCQAPDRPSPSSTTVPPDGTASFSKES